MPKGELGNLIALHLQGVPRKAGHSIVVDPDFQPYSDPWDFLSAVQRVPMVIAEQTVTEAQRKGHMIGARISVTDDEYRQDPWSLPESRKRLERPIQDRLRGRLGSDARKNVRAVPEGYSAIGYAIEEATPQVGAVG
jgi:hypothetical protein